MDLNFYSDLQLSQEEMFILSNDCHDDHDGDDDDDD